MGDGAIGLPRGVLRLRPSSPAWPELFLRERAALLSRLFEWVVEVEHVGSTSVPGLEAKPLIDMQAGLRRFDDVASVLPRLIDLGYTFMPDRVNEQLVFLPKGPESRRTHHLNLMAYGSDEWAVRLRFRDALRADRRLILRYRDLKRELAVTYAGDRPAYTAAKTGFVLDVLARHP